MASPYNVERYLKCNCEKVLSDFRLCISKAVYFSYGVLTKLVKTNDMGFLLSKWVLKVMEQTNKLF